MTDNGVMLPTLSGRLCHGDGAHDGATRCRRVLMLPTLFTYSGSRHDIGIIVRRRAGTRERVNGQIAWPRAAKGG